MQPLGPQAWSTVNIVLPLQVGSREHPESTTGYFALAYWVLPRVPTLGEHIQVDAIGYRVEVERVTWDRRGRAGVHLREACVDLKAVKALEAEGWAVEPWKDEPPSDWLAAEPE
jgi:hypothetical protein